MAEFTSDSADAVWDGVPGGETAVVRKASRWSRATKMAGVHPWRATAALLVLGGVGIVAFTQIRALVDPPYETTSYTVPTAAKLTAASGETVFRIDPTKSSVRYQVDENIVGQKASTATGTTQGIAGDIALNRVTPGASRVGEIVVNVEQFHSDSSLRDARIRSDFLESHQYSLVRFVTDQITGLPASVQVGTRYDVVLTGKLTIKDSTRPVSWKASATLEGDELHVVGDTTVKMSDYGVGPISVVGLVSTSDDVKLRLDVDAADPTKRAIPTNIPDPTGRTTTAGGPSFARAVQPILEQNCAGCHRSGAIGADVWRLDTAGDAAEFASGIATVTASRYMPPWPPSGRGVPFQHARGLTSSQLSTLAGWAKHGGALDVDASSKLVDRSTKEPNPPRADITLKMPQMYVGDGTEPNDYRCFELDPKITTPTYVTGSKFTAGTPKIVHHALIYRTSAASGPALHALDGKDGRPGWACGTGGAPISGDDAGAGAGGAARAGGDRTLFSGWVPGARPRQLGTNQGFLFEPGDLVIMQIHYHYSKGVLGDVSTLALQTTAPTPEMHNLVSTQLVAPVELPCPAPATGPLCDRAASIADQAKRYGPTAGIVPDLLLSRCGAQNVTSDPVTGNGTSKCDWRIGRNGDLVDFMGHMHTRGKSFRMTLNPGTTDEKVLLDIPAWNFDWQINYQPIDAIPVHRGDRLRIECSWDRSQRNDSAPRYITFAEGTEDEMCFATYTVDPNKATGAG